MSLKPLLVAITLMTVATSAGSQSPASAALHLTLPDAIARGYDASRRVAELRARESGARAALASSEAADRPVVSAQAGYSRTNHVEEFFIVMPGFGTRALYPDIPTNYRTRLDLQWPIYSGGRTDALQRAAAAEIGASQADIDAARAELRLEITRAYWALVTAEESVRVLGEALKRADAHLADVRNAFQVGLVPPNDVASVEAQESRQRMLLVQAQSQRDVAAAALRRLVGVAADVELVLDARLDVPVGPSPAPAALLVQARESRAERAALARRTESAAARRDAAEAGRRPAIGIGGGVDVARPNPRIFPRKDVWKESWDAGINLTWSLWDGGRTRAAVAEAAAAADALRQRLADFDTLLDLEVRQRTIELTAATAAVAAAADSVRAAGEARRVVQDRYASGVATNTEVLDAQVALLQAELDRTRALADVRLAEARLERAVGRP